MASSLAGYFTNAQSVREASAGTYKTEFAFRALIIAATAVAVAAAETFTCSVSTTGVSAQDVQNNVRFMITNGFTVSLSGSTLTISW
jgi:hypothetical protein